MMVAVLAVVCIALAIYLRGAEGSISFSLEGANGATYTEFIKTLRAQLTYGTQSVYGIPVLNPEVSASHRFIRVDLFNNPGQPITVAIDVVNVNVVAYHFGNRSHFFRQANPNVPVGTLFPNTLHLTLPFTDSYTDLERAAGESTEKIPLGLSSLNSAIIELRNDVSVARSLLIIFQMVSEAVRFRFIETQVRQSIPNYFLLGNSTLSLENNWSALSKEIQRGRNGVFLQTVQLRNISNNPVPVDSILSPVIAGLALMLYHCDHSNALAAQQPSIIRMRVDALVGEDNGMCVVGNRTTHFSGRDGLCVDVRHGNYTNGNSIQTWGCEYSPNEEWTLHTDGTIRSRGKCMTTSGYSPKSNIMIYDCGAAPRDATQWALSTDGTITNPRSGLALTALLSPRGTPLTLETNTHYTGQGWTAGNMDPLVASIIGYKDLCMQANENNNRVWLENCVHGNQKQKWAFYGDGTIRVNSSRSLCLTSNGHSDYAVIIILKCEGWVSQRWVFKTDGSILNPHTNMVMDVKGNDVSLKEIILWRPNQQSNQQWLPFF